MLDIFTKHSTLFSHGLNRLQIYIEDTLGNVAKSGKPTILKQKGATAWVDGQNLLGMLKLFACFYIDKVSSIISYYI